MTIAKGSYSFREPGGKVRSCPEALLLRGIVAGGFAVAPFDMNPDNIFTFADPQLASRFSDLIAEEGGPVYPAPAESTPEDVYLHSVREAAEYHRRYSGKTVISRAIRVDVEADADRLFTRLCELYPDAFVFRFSSSLTGTWVAATPELLLRASDASVSTMALAGTRPAGTPGDWDVKNREEQQYVAMQIMADLSASGLFPQADAPYSHRAGSIEHICTLIKAPLPDGWNMENVRELLGRMSPTPALGGFPRAKSMNLIRTLETHRRGYYGGFAGFISSATEFAFYVNLRSALLRPEALTLFVGGGITHLSDPQAELAETVRKSHTLLAALGL